MTIEDSQICNNEACLNGGGLYNSFTDTIIDNCLFDSNRMITNDTENYSGGGGIFVYGLFSDYSHETLILNSTIINNTADNTSLFKNCEKNGAYGGGIYAEEASVTVENSTIESNFSGYAGGGAANYSYQDHSYMTISNSVIRLNQTGVYGGGIYSGRNFYNYRTPTSNLTVTDSVITDNTADSNGGGIIAYDSYVILASSTVTSNSAGVKAGGFGLASVHDFSVATVTFNDINSNNADEGAGIYILDQYSNDWLTATIYGNNIHDNAADSNGGGIYIYNQYVSGEAVEPAVYNADGDPWLEFDCPASNTAAVEGNDTTDNNNHYSGNTVNSDPDATGVDIEFEP